MSNPQLELAQQLNRRHFLSRSGVGLGAIALGSLMGRDAVGADTSRPAPGGAGGMPGLPHFPAKAKRVIYLFQSGAPSQLDLFDNKPAIQGRRGIELPDSVRMGQRITTMTSGQKSLPVAPTIFKFGEVRRVRGRVQRALAVHRGGRGRPLCHPVRSDRGDQP